MNNYNLKAVKEKNKHIFFETSFYWGPGLPIFASKKSVMNELESCLNESAEDILKSGMVELSWVDEKNNLIILDKLLAQDENVSFLPEQYREQVVNAKKRQQPCYFFVEKGIRKNFRGSWELRLRQSCEAEPHKKGFKYGYKLSVVLASSVHQIIIDGGFNILDIIEDEDILLPNTAFGKVT